MNSHTRIRNFFLGLCLLPALVIASAGQDEHAHGHDEHAEAEITKGPHGGRLLQQDDFALELTLFEQGASPEFRVYAYDDGETVKPEKVALKIELHRLGGDKDVFAFVAGDDYLRGDGVVHEPHSFDVHVQARYNETSYTWQFESYEGRTQIEDARAQQAGVTTSVAGPARIVETEMLYGTVRPNEERVLRLQAPYAGQVREVRVSVGDRVDKGQVLARIQSLQSLETYSITAPTTGVILSRHVNPGEQTTDEALFVLADLSEVWVDFAAFPSQQKMLKKGQRIIVQSNNNQHRAQTQIDYLAPVGASVSQSTLVRARLSNLDGDWKPGLLVTGDIVVSEQEVPLAVKTSALQTFRDFTVVFAKFGDVYEVRMLDLGRRDAEHVEVLGGLKPGTEYVSGNSYLIKADVLKSGASHAH